MLQRYLLIWLCLLSAVAFYWTQWVGDTSSESPWVRDPFSASKPYLGAMIAVTMFALGWMLPRDEVRQVLTRWRAVLGGTTVQYLTMPLLAFLVVKLFALTGPAMIGVIMVGCVPGAMASNVLTLNARGNTSYSVSLTTLATMLSPLVVPLALWLTLGKKNSPEPINAAIELLWTIVLPVVMGNFFSRRVDERFQPVARRIGAIIANLVILWIIAVVVGLNREHLAQSVASIVVPLLLINLGGYLIGYRAAKRMGLPEPMRRALTLEIGMQNAGVGTLLAIKLFPDQPETAIAPAMYTFGCMLTGTALARWWAMRSDRQESAADAS
jgi:BASS family bile acid:Na+ symporter